MKLQRAQNALGRVVTFTKRIYQIRPVLQKLHWLSIRNKIDFKCSSRIHSSANWLSSVLGIICCRVFVYTAATFVKLQLPSTRTVMSRCAFSQVAPRVFNDLSISLVILSHLIILELLYCRLAFDDNFIS